MTHSTKNAIELKCSKELLERSKPVAGRGIGVHHDACVAHALMKAMKELRENGLEGDFTCEIATDWITRRAAEILESEYGIKS
jgi:hypothetical protein